mmetsp:Transcript_76452/g.151265  ORF Transcript_76452/g.151265 Transcript_76452/m.151265 type:complete len:197 (+) Transcript_76452:82-672(+)
MGSVQAQPVELSQIVVAEAPCSHCSELKPLAGLEEHEQQCTTRWHVVRQQLLGLNGLQSLLERYSWHRWLYETVVGLRCVVNSGAGKRLNFSQSERHADFCPEWNWFSGYGDYLHPLKLRIVAPSVVVETLRSEGPQTLPQIVTMLEHFATESVEGPALGKPVLSVDEVEDVRGVGGHYRHVHGRSRTLCVMLGDC